MCLFFYLVAGFGDLRNDNDPNMTYEGENNVLLQQASNWLLSCRKNGYAHFAETSPLKSAQFLSTFDKLITQKCGWTTTQDALNPQSKHKLKIDAIFAKSSEIRHKINKILSIKNPNLKCFRHVECIGLAGRVAAGKDVSTLITIAKERKEYVCGTK